MTRLPSPRTPPRARPRSLPTPVLCAGALSAVLAARPALAEGAPAAEQRPPDEVAVDVRLAEAPPPHRTLTIEWNPLALFIDRFSLNAVVVPGDHHALVLSPFYTWAGTAEYSTGLNADGTPLVDTTGAITGTKGASYVLNVPRQTFTGFGGELGYRYYFAEGGPRGVFLGPSLILEGITAKAYNGSETSFAGYGLAADLGYEALIADTVAVSVGVGGQYLLTSRSIPPQQLPASIYANERFYPRLLLSFGYAF
jgi:hypothetical protein